MAKPRRTFTDEDKAKVVAYCAEHGQKLTAEHFNIATSMVNRWKSQAQPQRAKGQWRKKKWTDAKIAAVLEFNKTHSNTDTLSRFKISSSQLSLWKRGLTHAAYKRRKTNGAQPVTNGLGQLPQRDALMWLQRWRDAYFDRVKAETPSAASVLESLKEWDK